MFAQLRLRLAHAAISFNVAPATWQSGISAQRSLAKGNLVTHAPATELFHVIPCMHVCGQNQSCLQEVN